jgi:hypothetical protein
VQDEEEKKERIRKEIELKKNLPKPNIWEENVDFKVRPVKPKPVKKLKAVKFNDKKQVEVSSSSESE